MVARLAATGSLSAGAVEPLVRSLFEVPFNNGTYAGGIAAWLESTLLSALPGSTSLSVEARLIAALSGPSQLAQAPRISWEGQDYRFDPATAERKRLEIVRERQGGASIDTALTLVRIAKQLRVRTTSMAIRARSCGSSTRS